MSDVAEQPKQGAKCKCVEMEDGRWKASGWAQVGELYLEFDATGETKGTALSNLESYIDIFGIAAIKKFRAAAIHARGV